MEVCLNTEMGKEEGGEGRTGGRGTEGEKGNR